MERRGMWMWYVYAACTALFLICAFIYGPAAVAFGIVGIAFGLERVAATWDSDRRRWSVAFLAWIGLCAVIMLLPIWGHVNAEGSAVRHEHYLWERDHRH